MSLDISFLHPHSKTKAAMLFSEAFQVQRGPEDDWFDPILEMDTRLFVDPFLLESRPGDPFEGSSQELVRFFDQAFQLFAAATGPGDARWQVAAAMLRFPEPFELRLGYTSSGIQGRGAGQGLGDGIIANIVESVEAGLQAIERFEELPLFHQGVGHDLISDLCVNVLKHRFIRYTQDICRRHDIPMRSTRVAHAGFDYAASRWVDAMVELPVAPDGLAVVLTPKSFLRRLPTISKQEFLDYLWAQEGETLRTQFGYELKRQVHARDIVAIARRRRDFVDSFRVAMAEIGRAYPIDRDPDGIYQPYVQSRLLALTDAFVPPSVSDMADMRAFTRFVVDDFVRLIEGRRQSALLWNDDGTPRRERASKLVFFARAEVHCQHVGVSIVMEADTGAGPVDIHMSRDQSRSLVELKLMSNSSYWHGLDTQLPAYVSAAGFPAIGTFLGIALDDAHAEGERYTTLSSRAREAARRHRLELVGVPVDARPRPSASHL